MEFVHWTKQLRTYKYFNELYIEPLESKAELIACIDTIISKDTDFFERTKLSSITSYVTNKEQMYNSLAYTRGSFTPSDQLHVGSSRLYWSYTPLLMDLSMKQLRVLGEYYMYWNGYSSQSYLTNDGYYNVFTYRNTTNTKRPLIFFPGLGFGAIPYVHVAKLFNRTVHIVEIPNFCYATPHTNTHTTGRTLTKIVNRCVGNQEHDVISHSFGSFIASVYLNTSYKTKQIKNVIVCEGFTNPIDVVMCHIIPFVNFTHFGHINVVTYSLIRFVIFLKLFVHNIYIHSYCKRHINVVTDVNWRDYGNIQIKYIYSENDELMDSKYIISKMVNKEERFCIPKGKHGSCFFGKHRNNVIDWVNTNWY